MIVTKILPSAWTKSGRIASNTRELELLKNIRPWFKEKDLQEILAQGRCGIVKPRDIDKIIACHLNYPRIEGTYLKFGFWCQKINFGNVEDEFFASIVKKSGRHQNEYRRDICDVINRVIYVHWSDSGLDTPQHTSNVLSKLINCIITGFPPTHSLVLYSDVQRLLNANLENRASVVREYITKLGVRLGVDLSPSFSDIYNKICILSKKHFSYSAEVMTRSAWNMVFAREIEEAIKDSLPAKSTE